MSSLRTSTFVAAALGTATVGALSYAVYFDYKRRNDVEFRKALKRESKRTAKAAKVEAEESTTRDRAELRALVDEANAEGFPESNEEKEQYLWSRLAEGESLSASESTRKEAALSLFKALQVYPQPKELMQLFDKTVPKPVLDTLAEMVAYDHMSMSDSSANSSTGGVE